MINNFTGVGNLTRNAELKYTGSGVPCLKFSICINKSYKKDGEWTNKPNFFNCIIWGKYAESMCKHLTKGRLIGITGELDHNPWTDNDGSKHNDVNIAVSNISFIGKSKNNDAPDANNGDQGEPDISPDNIPF